MPKTRRLRHQASKLTAGLTLPL